MPRKKRAGKGEASKPESQSMYRDEDGRLCIGNECVSLKLPEGDGPIEVDLSECDEDVKKAIGDHVMKGAPTAYDFRKVSKPKPKSNVAEVEADADAEAEEDGTE